MEIKRILGQLTKYQGTVSTPKAKIVFDGVLNLYISRSIGAVVQIALGILIEDIDGGWRFLVMESQNGENRFQATRTTQ
jgi:hypothetical protein